MRLARRAAASLGSSAESSRSTPRSGRQKSSLSSMTILASSASTRPSGVVTSGLISASEAPLLDEGAVELLHDLGRRLDLAEVAVEGEGERQRLVREAGRRWDPPASRTIFSGVLAATSSMSTPPAELTMNTGPLGLPVHDEADVALAGDLGGRHHQHLVHGEPLDRHAQDLRPPRPRPRPGCGPASRRRPCPGRRRAPAP